MHANYFTLVSDFLTRYSYAVGVFGMVVVCLSVICPSVTNVLCLNDRS